MTRFPAVLLLLLLASCATPVSPQTYTLLIKNNNDGSGMLPPVGHELVSTSCLSDPNICLTTYSVMPKKPHVRTPKKKPPKWGHSTAYSFEVPRLGRVQIWPEPHCRLEGFDVADTAARGPIVAKGVYYMRCPE